MAARRRRKGSRHQREVPVLVVPFDWRRNHPHRFRSGRLTGGPTAYRRFLFVPLGRETVQEWCHCAPNDPADSVFRPLPPGSAIADQGPERSKFISRAGVPDERLKTWSARVEILAPRQIRFRITSSKRDRIQTDELDPAALRWLELYWARVSEEAEHFHIFLEAAPLEAIKIYEDGFSFKDPESGNAYRLKSPNPHYLLPALEHPQRKIRERALAALGEGRDRNGPAGTK